MLGRPRIPGLMFKRYVRMLRITLRGPEAAAGLDRIIADIASAPDHLHSLGFAHVRCARLSYRRTRWAG